MYNGVGLPTVKGSGTNGYVQNNLASLKKITEIQSSEDETEGLQETKLEKEIEKKTVKPLNKEILEHLRKREIEVKCFEQRVLLEDEGFSEQDIEEQVNNFRTILLEEEEQIQVTYGDKKT